VTATADSGRAVLHDACRGGKLWLVRTLIEEHGVDAELANPGTGGRPLHYAVSGHQFDVINYLLDRGADISARDTWGSTPLHYAAADGSAKLTRYLLERGAEIDAQSHEGATPLFDAAEAGHTEAVRILVKAGADRTLPDKGGRTPFDVAKNDPTRGALGA
jgi:ankyrin repeat protein